VTDDFLRELDAELKGEVLLGHEPGLRRGVYLGLDDLKETSVHVIGAAGYGKSYYLRHLIDQLVIHHQSFAVIDPHREIYEYALWRLRRAGVRAERIVPLDPSDEQYAIGFNPLSCGLTDAGETASMVLEAFLKAWGARSFDATPRLEGILRGMFRLLIESRLTLLEGNDFLNVDNVALRRTLRERVSDPMIRQDWAEVEKLDRADKLALFESSRNRLRRVLQATSLQRMLAQTKNTLDFKAVLDDGKYLLANLGSISAPETQRLIGALLMNGLFHAAKRRDSRRRRDWFLICDEFGEYATRDFANSLDALRKFGVHLVLAHQRLAQLEREDADVLSAVMTNAKIKVVFGGLERPEAERMARELFTGDVRGDRPKHVIYQTKFRPVLDTFEVKSESWSDSEGESETDAWSSGTSFGFSGSEGEGFIGDDNDVATRSLSRSEQSSSNSGESGSHGRNSSHSRSGSRSVVPITRSEEFREESGRQYWSLDEEWEQRIARVHRLDKRHALIKVYNRPAVQVLTPEIYPEKRDARWERFRLQVLERCRYVKSIAAVVTEINARRKMLAALVEDTKTQGRPVSIKSFRE
jgi:hypothetical protein